MMKVAGQVQLLLLLLCVGAQAFSPSAPELLTTTAARCLRTPRALLSRPSVSTRNLRTVVSAHDPAQLAKDFNSQNKENRLKFLTDQAVADLKTAVDNYQNPVFTTALIAGDDVLLDLIHRAGLMDKIKIIFIDTFHLFPETHTFLADVEKHYKFKSAMYKAQGCDTVEDFHNKYSDDLFLEDVEEYDKVAKVEPLLRGLKESETKLWINGRRRDQGFERAALEVWEVDKMNPIAFWTFEDCWDYIHQNSVPYHPLHDDGYPSIGDMHSTLRVDREKWFQYGMERAGRFQNMQNKDGTPKSECGIHTVASPIADDDE